MKSKIDVLCNAECDEALAKITLELNANIINRIEADNINFVFSQEQGKLVLHLPNKKQKPFFVDFSKVSTMIENSTLLKATKIAQNSNWTVLDATAGFGQDGSLLALFATNILFLERNIVIYNLLKDGIRRQEKITGSKGVEVINCDSIEFLDSCNKFDLIYLDPLFPKNVKKALSKTPMQIIDSLCEKDNYDSDRLIEKSLAKARVKVVVKRHKHSPYLGNIAPDFQIKGKSHRFDIYQIRK
jgi:16S rRNA (guanine1516-N2)-methyltransferase